MNEQRFNDYTNLIQKLLNCPSGEEAEILQSNDHLIDRELIAMMEWVAAEMAEKGEPKAECLQSLATQLAKAIAEWKQLNQQAVKLYRQGKFAEAFIVDKRALELVKKLHSGDHPDVAQSLNNLALLYQSLGRYEKAESLSEEALAMIKRLFTGDHPNVATSLNNLAALYNSQGRYEKAEPLYEESLAMRKHLFKGDHSDVALSLNNLAELYRSQGRYEKAEPLYEQALAMWQHLFEGDHPHVATSLNNLAVLYDSQGRYEKAEPLYEQALAIRKRLFEGDHPDVANSLNNLAELYNSQGRYEKAEPLCEQALAMIKRLFAGDHPNVATSLNNLAALYDSQGRYEKAEPLYEQALAMRKHFFKGDHPDVANSFNNLALLYSSQGRYKKAEPLYEQALAMRKRLFVGNHPDIANSFNNLASLYNSQGRYEKAEPLYEQALAMRKRLFVGNHPDIANSFNNLAALYNSQGRYEKAEPLYEQALAMWQCLFASDHPNVATSLNNLAAFYNSQGHYEKAEPLYAEALAMRKHLFEGDHPDVATSLNNLALLYNYQGCYEKAEPLYEEALAMWQHLFEGDHPDIATSLNNLALLYDSQGRYEKAELLYEEALAMTKRLFADEHPDIAQNLNNLAILLVATNRPSQALELMKQAIEIEDGIIRRVFAASSEKERLHYLETIRSNFEALLSLVWKYLFDSPEAVQTALDVVLKRKSLTASAFAALNYALYSDRYSHLAADFQKLRSLRAEEIHLIYSPPLPEAGMSHDEFLARQAAHKQELDQLEAQCEALEKRLASQVPEIQLQEQPSDRRAVALELPEGSVLVEFVRFRVFDFTASPDNQWQPARYLAFILSSQQPEAVQAIDLGDAEHIDELIRVFRETSTSLKLENLAARRKNNPLTAETNQFLPKSYTKAGWQLRQAICDPIREKIGNCQHWIVAPDGALNLVPLQILPTDETGDRLLMNDYRISYLSVGRDILRRKIQTQRQASQDLIIADPDFDLAESIFAQKSADLPKNSSQKISFQSATDQILATLSGEQFHRAPGTRFLGESVAKKLGVNPFLEREALESLLKNGKCPRILLIATHGYFATVEDRQLKLISALLTCPNGEERDILQAHATLCDRDLIALIEKVANLLSQNGNPDAANKLQNSTAIVTEIINQPYHQNQLGDRASAVNIENPMMRSGLAFAGANTWLSGGTLPPEAGKGLLFAQDVAILDLWANELTVLSACDTGVGDVKIGEGVFGLRRAFAVAGAKTLVMSLWPVPDKVTALLMDRFFDNLQRGLGRAEALQNAQYYIRSITLQELQQFSLGLDAIDELKEKRLLSPEFIENQPNFQPLKHPYFWGAWVCQGDTTAIENFAAL